LLLPQAWRELSNDLAPSAADTMTIRCTVVDGEPDLTSEMRQGSNFIPVQYAQSSFRAGS
jgi:hypothetical protein